MIDRIRNGIRQWIQPGTKLFFIGFNKCGTTALHKFLIHHGVRSAHWQHNGLNLALEIERRAHSLPEITHYLSTCTAYSDLTFSSPDHMIDGNRHFELFHQAYPDSYFVLNDREVQRWIRSRASHRRGEYLANSMAFYELDRREIEQKWRQDHARHVDLSTKYLSGNSHFLHFYVDSDPESKLTEFLAPAFRLDPAYWKPRNVTPPGQHDQSSKATSPSEGDVR